MITVTCLGEDLDDLLKIVKYPPLTFHNFLRSLNLGVKRHTTSFWNVSDRVFRSSAQTGSAFLNSEERLFITSVGAALHHSLTMSPVLSSLEESSLEESSLEQS